MKKKTLMANFLWIILAFAGCEDEISVREGALTGLEVDLQGSWQLLAIQRNGEQLGGQLDIVDYGITLNDDGTFSLSSTAIPFPTIARGDDAFSSGNWRFNDDFQPTEIQFINGSSLVSAKLGEPLYGNNNETFSMEFDLGCDANTYIYEFKRN